MSEPLPPAPPAAAAQASLDTLPFAVLIDEAWRATRRNARTILVPLLLALAPASLLMQVLVALWNLQLMGGDPASLDFTRMCGTLAIGGLAMLLIGFYFLGVYGTMMVASVRAVAGESPAVGPSARFYARPGVWGTDLLAWVLVMFGFLACIVPGLLLMAAWALRVAVMEREGTRGWAAMTRSWELLSHNPSGQVLRHPLLKALALFVLGIVLAYAVSFVIQLPAIVVSQVMIFREMARGEAADPQAAMRATLWLTIPAGVLGSLAQLAVQLYVDFATAHLYFDQRRRKEGTDLEAALDRLAGGWGAAGGPLAGTAGAPGGAVPPPAP